MEQKERVSENFAGTISAPSPAKDRAGFPPLCDGIGKPPGKQQSRTQAVFNAVPYGILVIDPSRHIIVDANTTAAQMLGRQRHDIVGSTCRKYVCATEMNRCPVTDLGRDLDNSERMLIMEDGSARTVLKTVVPVSMGGRRYLIETMADVTERKAAEEKLLASRFAIDKARDALFWVGPDGRFTYVNKAACLSLDYTEEELLSMTVFDVNPAFPREKWKDYWERVRLAGSFTVETVHKTKDGRVFPVEISVNFLDLAGKQYCCDYVRDLTERQDLESRLRQSQKMEAIGALAGGIAHDFNNLLTVILGYGNLLQTKIGEGDPMRLYVDQLLAASRKAANLTHSLLAFSRRQQITLSPLDLNDLVRGIDKILKRLITEDIRLEAILCEEDVTVLADATQIDQILFNLATNARDAMPAGGTLTIETRHASITGESGRPDGPRKPGIYGVISVSDTGTGMDDTTLSRIFDPFFTTKEAGKGTGLGLSTVYAIVKQHEGYIDVTSERSRGTTFTIYLPVASKKADRPDSLSLRVAGGSERILVAEDSEEVRQFLTLVLRANGYKVLAARDGREAIDLFRGNSGIRLLILDSVMPEKNGREVYNEIRAASPGIPALFTSGYTRDVILDKGIEEGKFDFLVKPVSAEKLLTKVREMLDRKA